MIVMKWQIILLQDFKPANLISKNDIVDFVKKIDFDIKKKQLKNYNKEIILNKTKHVLIQNELKEEQDKFKKLQTFDSSLFIGQSYFFNDGS